MRGASLLGVGIAVDFLLIHFDYMFDNAHVMMNFNINRSNKHSQKE